MVLTISVFEYLLGYRQCETEEGRLLLEKACRFRVAFVKYRTEVGEVVANEREMGDPKAALTSERKIAPD